MRTYSSKKAILALVAVVAFIGSASILVAESAPINENINVNRVAAEPGQLEAVAVANGVKIYNYKRQQHSTTTTTTRDTAPKPPAPTTSTAPRPTNPPKATPTTTTTRAPAATRSSTTTTSSSRSTSSTATAASPSASDGSESGTPGENGVPTDVNSKLFIGLGTVGGLIVFALGGVAFCRHRRKKNLATALLQQTAQFNNNNPYAKLQEASTPKESLPMTPTKPLGTYNVVAIYTPALADEVELGLGDSVTILQEFDDGWCMGINNSRGGSKGVFPRHCVEMGPYEGSQHGAPGGPHFPPSPSFKATANKRMSSMAPAWNGGYHGDAGYPPNPQYHGDAGYPPNPQYPGPNHGNGGGYYNGGGY
ncbi:hypothetical protein BGZ76_008234 [Entomortierella beljakovae]|nr:hypothetical protein BGZ76_008234 [Entomortierella beljakovae]